MRGSPPCHILLMDVCVCVCLGACAFVSMYVWVWVDGCLCVGLCVCVCVLLASVRDTHGRLEKVAEEGSVLLVGPAHEGEPSLSFLLMDVCVF